MVNASKINETFEEINVILNIMQNKMTPVHTKAMMSKDSNLPSINQVIRAIMTIKVALKNIKSFLKNIKADPDSLAYFIKTGINPNFDVIASSIKAIELNLNHISLDTSSKTIYLDIEALNNKLDLLHNQIADYNFEKAGFKGHDPSEFEIN